MEEKCKWCGVTPSYLGRHHNFTCPNYKDPAFDEARRQRNKFEREVRGRTDVHVYP